MDDHLKMISSLLQIAVWQVSNTIQLAEDGATIPFISRYRKEKTGNLDEVLVQQVLQEDKRLKELYERKVYILETIKQQNKLSSSLEKAIQECYDTKLLEELYAPYKKKKATRGDMAKTAGLEPLAKFIMAQKQVLTDQILQKYHCEGYQDNIAVIQGAKDIIAEWINEHLNSREKLKNILQRSGLITSKVVKSKKDIAEKYQDYFEFAEPIKKCPSHRFLAIMRGANEGLLTVGISIDDDQFKSDLYRLFIRSNDDNGDIVQKAIDDAYKRLMFPSIESSVLNDFKAKADTAAIQVFSQNLRQLLLAPPLGTKATLAIDPGFRTGCKLAALDSNGNLIQSETIYPHSSNLDAMQAIKTIKYLVENHQIKAIAIGNGTASRETESFIRKMTLPEDVKVYMVSESGASIYSASETAREEFPELDITIRGAISIGRRLMDPLSELVKIDPKSIGVGQYQHDVNSSQLKESLDQTVISCVNSVGVNLNTASNHVLQYIAGLGPSLARNIVEYRKENGNFTAISELTKVPRLGQKAYEQCAGFLRIKQGKNILDDTGIHPETYSIVEKMASTMQTSIQDFIKTKKFKNIENLEKFTDENFGLLTLKDILKELDKPGLDPRGENSAFAFDKSVQTISDLYLGQKLPGIINNVTDFGAFVDLGIKESGLIHISKMSNTFVSNPHQIVKVSQEVQVEIIDIDTERKRIQLKLL
ncbi:MAG: Tex family protein [Saprospiraceae bacterium]